MKRHYVFFLVLLALSIWIYAADSVAQSVTVTEFVWGSHFTAYGTHPGDRIIALLPTDTSFDVTITFSEDVTGFTQSDIALSGGATTSVTSLTGSGAVYTVTITVTYEGNGEGDGLFVMEIPEGAVQNDDDEDNAAYSTADQDPVRIVFTPGLEIVVPEEPQNGPFDIVFKFTETVTEFTQQSVEDYSGFADVFDDIDASITAWNENSDGNEYTATITPGSDGTFPIIRYPAYECPAKNSHGAQVVTSEASLHSVQVDITAPTVTITDVPTQAQNSEFTVTITFNEDVTGFADDDIDLTGTASATVTDLTEDVVGREYTAEITPTTDGEVSIQVPADAAEDTAENGNTVSQSQTVTVDLTPPTLTITNVPTQVQNTAFTVTITFNEDVTGFADDDIDLTGTASATVTGFTEAVAAREYTAEITPTTDGDVSIQVPADAAEDTAGNGNTVSQSQTVTVDLTPPTLTITDVPTDIQNSEFTVKITFNEDVTGFADDDIDLTGTASATVTDLTEDVVGREYTAEITPITDGEVSIQVPADAVDDTAGNGNTVSGSQTVTVDLTPPTLTITDVPTDTQNSEFTVKITFNEDVTGFADDDIDLTGTASATVTDLTEDVAAREYTAEITPTTDGEVSIQVPADAAEDTAGNGNTVSQSQTVTVDLTSPTVTITDVPTDIQNSAFTVTITFSENVTGFAPEDIEISANTSATVSGSGNTYTAEITPPSDAEGIITFQIREDAADDTAGNGNTASDTHTVPVDLRRPTVEITVDLTPTDTGMFEGTIIFSEDVTGFVQEDIEISANTSATVSGSRSTYTVTITPAANAEEVITLQVRENAAYDAAGNGNIESLRVPISTMEWIPDLNLRVLVRDTLGLSTDAVLAKVDLLDLTVLNTAEIIDSEDYIVTDLTGLEYATELTELYLNENSITDLRPLAGLTQLTVLSLNDNEIESIFQGDINPLENLSELTELSLDNNEIDDISALEPLVQLTVLSLNGNQIDDISALESLTELTQLSLDRNLIEDISALEGLTELTTLSLNENPIDDLSPLESLTELTGLSLNENSIDDISFCAALTQLKILCLENNEITDVSTLADLSKLETIKLTGNPIDDTTPLVGIARHIEADEPIASLIPDEALAEILRDIFDLDTEARIIYADMRSLTALEATDSDITDLSGLEHATELETLDLRGNAIEDITSLAGLTKLTTLDLGVNSISKIDSLAGLTALLELYLEENSIVDIKPLVDLESLEILKLEDNPIADARPLAVLTDVDIDIDVTMYLVEFPDAGLAAALRDALELDAEDGIPSTQLIALTSLDARNRQISDLTGLELATALTELDLRENAITDVTLLAGLVNLETLRLTGNPFTDASPLANLTADIEADIVVPGVIADLNLAAAIRESLGLSADTRIIAATLKDLKDLDVQDAEIETLAGLEHATDLTTLKIPGGDVTDLTPLQTLTKLTTLEINSDAITDLTALQTLTQLTILELKGGVIEDISSLSGLTALTELNLSGNSINDIGVLEKLDGLKTLDLSDNSISNIASLKELELLNTLDLGGNSINNIASLRELTGLATLDLSGNNITSIDVLKELSSLKILNLSGNTIESIDALKELTSLTTLELSGSNIADIGVLQGLVGLTTLELGDNNISSIDALKRLTRLTVLNLGSNNLVDIQPLEGLVALRQLYLATNDINDVSALVGLVNLELLRLAGNPIMDTSPLFTLTTNHKLTDVDIEISQWAPWDVNQDGNVDATDSTLVTAAIGQTGEGIANSLTDVNGDGTVDADDLLLVTDHFDTDAAGAPSRDSIVALLSASVLKSLNRATLESELNRLIVESDGSVKYQRAIQFLQDFLVALRPNETRLLANYPNPFNPETWIPYQLATTGDVEFTIYNVRGTVVRRLVLGHQQAGYYVEKNRAAYWDGRNAVGERVASGIYFYELRANDISAVRKMVILK